MFAIKARYRSVGFDDRIVGMIIKPSLKNDISQYVQSLTENIKNSDELNRLFYKKSHFHEGVEAEKILPTSYLSNPYFELLKGIRGKIDDCELQEGFYHRNQLFLFGETYGDPSRKYLEKNPLGYFEEGFSFPELREGGLTWMSLIPHEINTMESPLKKTKGKILTMGLGLGYFAFMASEKPEVETVDVIENDPKVIELFSKWLLPLFPHANKIHIIEEDALAFAHSAHKNYDFAFIDLYHTEEDGLPLYLALKPLDGSLTKSGGEVAYWIERTLLASLRRYLIALLEEEENGSSDKDYQITDEFPDLVFSKLHYALKKIILNKPEDVMNLLSDQSLKQIASTLLK